MFFIGPRCRFDRVAHWQSLLGLPLFIAYEYNKRGFCVNKTIIKYHHQTSEVVYIKQKNNDISQCIGDFLNQRKFILALIYMVKNNYVIIRRLVSAAAHSAPGCCCSWGGDAEVEERHAVSSWSAALWLPVNGKFVWFMLRVSNCRCVGHKWTTQRSSLSAGMHRCTRHSPAAWWSWNSSAIISIDDLTSSVTVLLPSYSVALVGWWVNDIKNYEIMGHPEEFPPPLLALSMTISVEISFASVWI